MTQEWLKKTQHGINNFNDFHDDVHFYFKNKIDQRGQSQLLSEIQPTTCDKEESSIGSLEAVNTMLGCDTN